MRGRTPGRLRRGAGHLQPPPTAPATKFGELLTYARPGAPRAHLRDVLPRARQPAHPRHPRSPAPRPAHPAHPRLRVLRDGPHRPPPAHRRAAVHREIHGADLAGDVGAPAFGFSPQPSGELGASFVGSENGLAAFEDHGSGEHGSLPRLQPSPRGEGRCIRCRHVAPVHEQLCPWCVQRRMVTGAAWPPSAWTRAYPPERRIHRSAGNPV